MTELMQPTTSVAGELDIGLITSEQDARAAVRVLCDIWGQAAATPPLAPEMAWALVHSGNYVSLARVGEEPIAAAVAFRGVDENGPLLHSHIAGVLERWQGSSVGFALKQHQRRWAQEAGLERITWTFDPLVARNAYFNVMKLGARLARYYVDFYGELDDEINTGDETDRCLVEWPLHSPRATAAAAGSAVPVDLTALRDAGAVEALVVGADQRPVRGGAESDGEVRLLQVPGDIVALRRSDPALAAQWRRALRAALEPALHMGFEVTGVSRDSWYVLTRG